jgi:hypothetical protein
LFEPDRADYQRSACRLSRHAVEAPFDYTSCAGDHKFNPLVLADTPSLADRRVDEVAAALAHLASASFQRISRICGPSSGATGLALLRNESRGHRREAGRIAGRHLAKRIEPELGPELAEIAQKGFRQFIAGALGAARRIAGLTRLERPPSRASPLFFFCINSKSPSFRCHLQTALGSFADAPGRAPPPSDI